MVFRRGPPQCEGMTVKMPAGHEQFHESHLRHPRSSQLLPAYFDVPIPANVNMPQQEPDGKGCEHSMADAALLCTRSDPNGVTFKRPANTTASSTASTVAGADHLVTLTL